MRISAGKTVGLLDRSGEGEGVLQPGIHLEHVPAPAVGEPLGRALGVEERDLLGR